MKLIERRVEKVVQAAVNLQMKLVKASLCSVLIYTRSNSNGWAVTVSLWRLR